MNWTPSQQKAIDHSGENILLSAAAGSGKTAVLVQRVINMILNKDVCVNELLILTFTEAAAAEMKRKIAAAINREFLADPHNEHLKKQRILINSANISTIHSFCLEVIKGNIHKTDIPVNFSIIDDIENTIMKEQALDEVLALFYENIEKVPSFKKLALGYGSDKGDKSLREIIMGLMNFAKSLPYPTKWLNRAAAAYKYDRFADSPWHTLLFDYSATLMKRIFEVYDVILEKADNELPENHHYIPVLTAEKEMLDNIARCIEGRDYAKTHAEVCTFAFAGFPGKRISDEAVKLAQENIKQFRELVKTTFSDIQTLFAADETWVETQMRETEPIVRTLKNIVLMTLRRHKTMKRQKDYIDFDDLEHELIGLLADKSGNPTDIALGLREKFKEILVDEYQDTNHIQDKIFSLISRDETNIFAVGDIKQSIYKFRNAVPEIFTGKYNKYQSGEGGRLIALAQNFRSRRNVIDFTNFVFERVMNEETGGITYGDNERLVFGATGYSAENSEKYATEFNIVNAKTSGDANRYEALSVGKRILEMVQGKELMIKDPKTEEERFVRYSDIVVLLRSTKTIAPVFEEVFSQLKIPCYSESGQSYLTSVEVQTVLSYLQIIDNPRQDIPLIAVLRSPMWRFTPDMLAKIRAGHRGVDFYEAMQLAADRGDVSCARFISDLEALRSKAEFLTVSDLVMIIYSKYNYIEIVSGMKNGKQKAENLRLLFERATEFDSSENGSLMGFMLYIETILASDKDLAPAKIEGENSDTVKIISIHKSKGLEYPVVILANAFGTFNRTDLNRSILRHDRYGIGLKYVDTENRLIYPSIPHKLITKLAAEELLAEEMRLLYVALTRAKEKLIISAGVKGKTSAWQAPYLAQDKILTAGVLGAKALGDFISYALARHGAADVLDDVYKISYDKNPDYAKLDIKIRMIDWEELEAETSDIGEKEALSNEAIDAELYEKLASKYAFSGETVPVKMSVSEAKRRQSEDEFYSPHIFTIPTISASDVSLISATDRGTITHFVLQHINTEKTNSAEEIGEEIDRMVSSGIISPVQRDTVNIKSLFDFFQSPVGKRLKNAEDIRKEFSFYTEADAAEFYPHLEGKGEKILLQGTMDCFFTEKDGNLVLLDYKTDRISEAEIPERSRKYLTQLKYYKKGLEAITGKPVKDAYICFLSCNKAIHIDEI